MKPAGYSVWWRADRRRWVLSYPAGGKSWKQHALPERFTKADKTAAHVYAVEWLAKAPEVKLPHVDAEGPTWRDLHEGWLALRRQRAVKPSSVLDNRSHLRVQILPTFGEDPVAALATSIPKVRSWIRELRGRLSPTRVRGAVSTFRMFVDDAIAEEWVRFAGNPLRSSAVDAELPPLRPPSTDTIPREHAQAVLDATKALPLDWRVRCCLAFCTGLDDGEIAGLRWSDAELDATVPTLRVAQAVAITSGARQGVTSPKRSSRLRVVPLHPAARAALVEWREVGAAVVLSRDPKPGDLILCRPDGSPTRPSSAGKLRRTFDALGLPSTTPAGKPLTFKAARRSFLTWLEAAGVSLERRQRLAGHAKASVTERHYTAGDLGALAADVAKIDLVWRAGSVPGVVAAGTSSGGSLVNLLGTSRPDGSRKRIRKPLLYPLSYGGDGNERRNLPPGTTTANGLAAPSGNGTGVLIVPGTTARVSAEIAKLAADLSLAHAFDDAIGAALRQDVAKVAEALARVARLDGHPDVADELGAVDAVAGGR